MQRMQASRRKQAGFTLVEIAIVLVIIGLLLGGVLKGQELITQAKIKNVSNDLNGVVVAVYGYQDRYKRLPGDDPGMTRWTVGGAALTAGQSGNGDNVIGVAGTGYNSGTPNDENRKFWLALRLAGFVAGTTANVTDGSLQPLNAASGIIGVQSGGLGLAGTIVCASNLPAKIAQALDVQMDDGDAQTGTVRSMLDATPPTALIATAPTTDYVDNGTNLYDLCKNI
jgi:prepilin-type N-terminal cleavage/methylation domain-containing protein